MGHLLPVVPEEGAGRPFPGRSWWLDHLVRPSPLHFQELATQSQMRLAEAFHPGKSLWEALPAMPAPATPAPASSSGDLLAVERQPGSGR